MPGIFSFLTTFGQEKINRIGESITQRIVAWDPETASQAEIEEMIAELDKVTIEAGKAMAEYEKEKREADAIQKNYDRYMSAGELLNRQLESAQSSSNQAKTSELNTSLEKLLHELETMKPEVERELREAEEAKMYYEEVKELAEVAAQKVRTAKGQLDQAKRDMKRAELDAERNKARAARAERLAGLKGDTSNLGVALAAMNRQAEQAKAAAAASDMKAKLLGPPDKDKGDANINAALLAVSGDAPKTNLSLSDRLAALKRK